MKRLAAGLAFGAALLAGCTGHMYFNPLGEAYNDNVAMARAITACDDAGGRASTDPASGCVVSRRGMKSDPPR
jgi:hypothetical protein